MKKIIIFILISASAFCEFTKLDISYGTSFYGKERDMCYKKEILQENKSIHANNNGKFIKIDIYSPTIKVENNNLYIGFGARFEEPLEVDSEFGNLNYLTPIYFSTLYLKNNKNVDFYSKFNIGYEFAFEKGDGLRKFEGDSRAKLSGGMYFGIESGIEYKKMLLGINYNQSSTKIIIPTGDNQVEGKVDRDFSTISLVLGYRFDI